MFNFRIINTPGWKPNHRQKLKNTIQCINTHTDGGIYGNGQQNCMYGQAGKKGQKRSRVAEET